MQAVFATALAVRGAPSIAASSPKISPALSVAMTFFFTISSTSPLISRYILSRNRRPFLPSAKMVSPAGMRSGLPPA